MGAGLSKTQIMNMALDYLEEETILDPDDKRAPARFLNRNFGITRDALLRVHPFNFALRRKVLAPEGVRPDFGWTYQYVLPSDCLRILPLTRDGTLSGPPIRFEVENDRILCDVSQSIRLRYVARTENTAAFDPLFCELLASTLALKAAHFITGKASYAERLQQVVQTYTAQAQTVDALEGTPVDVDDNNWINAR